MNGILEYAKSILFYLLFFKFFLLLLPEKSYETYARPAGMLFLLVLVLKPVISDGTGFEAALDNIRMNFFADAKLQEGMLFSDTDGGMEAVLSEYKKVLEAELCETAKQEGYAVKEVFFDISETADSYGSIRFLSVVLETEEGKKSGKVERIRVIIGGEKEKTGEKERRTKTAEELRLEEIFAAKYGIGKNQVDVTVAAERGGVGE